MKTFVPVKRLANGFELPCLGLGTWQMGGRKERDPNFDDSKAISIIQQAIERGIRHFDTAEMYAGGYSEELLGRAIAGSPRENLCIATKVWPTNLAYEDVKAAARRSLERLKLSYVDLYYIHMPNAAIPLADTMRGLNELVDEGLIRAIGVSNFLPERVLEAQRYSKHKIVANQVHYNLIYREPEHSGLLGYSQSQDLLLVAWRPVQYGDLSKAERESLIGRLALKYGKTPAQIALSWLICQRNVATIVKTLSPEHLEENIQAVEFKLEPSDVELLRKNFPNQQQKSDREPLS